MSDSEADLVRIFLVDDLAAVDVGRGGKCRFPFIDDPEVYIKGCYNLVV